MRSDADRLGDILLATAKIKERVAVSMDAFEHDEMPQAWVIHHLQSSAKQPWSIPGLQGSPPGSAVGTDRRASEHSGS